MQPVLAEGAINVVILTDIETFKKDIVTFLREVMYFSSIGYIFIQFLSVLTYFLAYVYR